MPSSKGGECSRGPPDDEHLEQTVRPCENDDPGRGQLPRPRVRVRRGNPPVHREREGLRRPRRGREHLHRLRRVVGADDPRARSPAVVSAIKAAAGRGTSYGAPTPGEVGLAHLIRKAFPSVEKVRLVSSGTEAAMSAVRLARGYTGRDKIIKFEGGYHG